MEKPKIVLHTERECCDIFETVEKKNCDIESIVFGKIKNRTIL